MPFNNVALYFFIFKELISKVKMKNLEYCQFPIRKWGSLAQIETASFLFHFFEIKRYSGKLEIAPNKI